MPATSAHGTERRPAGDRTVSPSSVMSTPTRSTQRATATGIISRTGVQGAAKASGTVHGASRPMGKRAVRFIRSRAGELTAGHLPTRAGHPVRRAA